MAAAWLDARIETPALVVDAEIFARNLDEMTQLARTAGVELLPHAKTHRMLAAGLVQMERGADGLTVAKVGEAEVFVEGGVGRIFVAYPLVGEPKARRALALHQRIDLTLGTDSLPGASEIGSVFAAAGQRAKVLLGIDTGLGREGIPPAEAPRIASAIADIDGIKLVGIYTHEGSVYSAVDRADLVRKATECAKTMVETATAIRALGIDLPVVSMGASASARVVALVPGVTQIRPGIYAFNDVGQLALGNASLETTSVRVIASVVSHPETDRACIDAGSKSLGSDLIPASGHRDEYPRHGLVVNEPGWHVENLSEEHGWLKWHGSGAPSALPVGTRLEIVPNHVCMAFAMLRKATVLRHGAVEEVWQGMGPGSSE